MKQVMEYEQMTEGTSALRCVRRTSVHVVDFGMQTPRARSREIGLGEGLALWKESIFALRKETFSCEKVVHHPHDEAVVAFTIILSALVFMLCIIFF